MADSAARVRVFSDDGRCVADPLLMRRALEYVKAFDGVIAQHAQDPRLTEDAQLNEGEISGRLGLAGWPAVAEEAIIARDCLLAAHVGSSLHVCHVSTAGSAEIIRWAKSKGWPVTAEVTPHHLLLTDELAVGYDPVFKVNPPLRTAADVAELRRALADGTIDCVATDHAPHPMEAKETEWSEAAFGMIGLETALRVVQQAMVDTGLLDWAASPTGCRSGRPDRPAGRPRRRARGRRPGQPHPVRPGGARRGGEPGRRVQEPQHPVRRDAAARPRGGDLPARNSYRARRKARLRCRRKRVAGARGWHHAARHCLRRRGRDVRRDGLQHRHDRIPGDADRPLVLPPDRGHDRPARRQHGRQRRRPRVPAGLGQRLRGARAGQARVQLAGHAGPGRLPPGRGRARHRRTRHQGADQAGP